MVFRLMIMKKQYISIILVVITLSVFNSCDEDNIFYPKVKTANGVVTVNGIRAGGLEKAMIFNLGTVTKLIITDTIDSRDFRTMRDKMPKLAELDLTNATIAAYNGFEGTGGTNQYYYVANSIPEFAFYNSSTSSSKTSLTSIKLPSNIISIRNYAFLRCSGLSGNITIPTSVTDTIGKSAFAFCTNISSITWSPVKFIDESAFQGCSGLTGTLMIPDSVLKISNSAFASCSKLSSISIPSHVQEIGNFAFKDCGALISVDSDNQNFLSIDGVLFTADKSTLMQCPISKTGSYEIPPEVLVIANSAFYNCAGLTSVQIPPSVFYIDDGAFSGCSGLTGTFPISEAIFGIGTLVFEGCDKITNYVVNPNNTSFSSADGVLVDIANTSVKRCVATKTGAYIIPTDITLIENGAFLGCNKLTSINIPASVTTIGNRAFANCTALIDIYSYATTPIDLTIVSTPFENINKNACTLHVPIGSKSKYRAAIGWNEFVKIVEI